MKKFVLSCHTLDLNNVVKFNSRYACNAAMISMHLSYKFQRHT